MSWFRREEVQLSLLMAPVLHAANTLVPLMVAWAWVFRASIVWLAGMLKTQPGTTTLALSVMGWMVLQAARARRGTCLHAVFFGVLAAVLSLMTTVQTLRAVLMVFSLMGLLGLRMGPNAWRSTAPAAGIAVLLLPLGDHVDAYLGFPARLYTAQLVAQVLGVFGFRTVTSETVLMIDQGIADIALECSGMRGLWTGLLLLCAVAAFKRQPLGLRFLVVGALQAIVMLVMNVVRVLVLVTLNHVVGWPAGAEMLHVPLGALGFVLGALVLILGFRASDTLPLDERTPGLPPSMHLALTVLMAALALGSRAAPIPRALPPTTLALPARLHPIPDVLTPSEIGLLGRHQTRLAQRHAIEWEGHRGSVLVVISESWRAHHPPELCLVGNGHTVEDSTVIAGSLRKMALKNGFIALAWFQSPSRVTPSLATRVMGEVLDGERRWAMVTVLLDSKIDDAALVRLHQVLAPVVRKALDGGMP